jgi:acyl-CoA synthetase (AMP-forming)/AMP-acid ligase II
MIGFATYRMMPELTIDDLLRQVQDRAKSQPRRIAIIQERGRQRIDYGELADRIARACEGLAATGLRAGDPVLFAVRPGIAQMVLLSALLLAGAAVVALDPGISARLFAERVRLLAPRWVVADSLAYAAGAPGPLRWWLRRRGLDFPDLRVPGARLVRVGARWPGVPASLRAGDLWSDARGEPTLTSPPRDRSAFIVFTSGTTGSPKAVEHTAKSIAAGCTVIANLLKLGEADVLCTTQAHLLLVGLLAGTTCVVPHGGPPKLAATLARHRATHVYAVPFEMATIARLLERRRGVLSRDLRTIVVGGAPVAKTLLARLRALCADATQVWCVYAMTEIFPVALVESREKLAFTGQGDLAGAPVAGVTIATADDGEIVVSGRGLFRGYVGGPDVAAHATGDLGRIDGGRLVLLGRKKDMIIRGCHNIYPSLYEEHVLALPGVERCALVGLPSPDHADERIVLAIEPRAGEDSVRLRARVARALRDGRCPIDAFAMPDEIVVCAVPHSGRAAKADRQRLVAMLAQRERCDA